MSKNITKIVLTGGPAAGKTSLISRILKEFKQENGWRVITIPETATDLISGFGIKPFGNCLSMLAFQDFVIADQLHKEKLALEAAKLVPEDNILIIYDRALMDDKAYISDEEFASVLAKFDGRTEQSVLANYDAVLHLVTCAKGAEFAYNLGNTARTESLEYAREMDDRTLRSWQGHPNLKIIDNSVDFNDKIRRAMQEIYRLVGEPMPQAKKRKYLISMPDMEKFAEKYSAVAIDMMQTYLCDTTPDIERRVRQQKNGDDYLYFYNEKHLAADGSRWNTEKPISEKRYIRFLMEGDREFHPVFKTKYRFVYNTCRYEIDVYPFCTDKAVLFCYTGGDDAKIPEELEVLKDVTGDPMYKNKQFARTLTL
ncbi:MAG: ATP-binding protein [Bacillota bacterium]|nr:ATP-binding protein [Bacillota bacterium]